MQAFIVENDDLLRDSMARLFRTKGYRVEAFRSAEEAEHPLEAAVPVVVICDQDLPGMDGLTFLDRPGASRPGITRILICAHPSPRVAERIKRSRIDGCLLKPFSAEEVEQVLTCLRSPGRS